MKVGIIRCMQTEDYCPGTTDFKMVQEHKGAFESQEDIEIVGFTNCGGCPGKKNGAQGKKAYRKGRRHNSICVLYNQGNPNWLSMSIQGQDD